MTHDDDMMSLLHVYADIILYTFENYRCLFLAIFSDLGTFNERL